MIKRIAKQLVYYLWVINGYLGIKVRSRVSQPLTVLITYYYPVRIRHVNHHIRNLLKCNFIEKIVLSSHNPEMLLEDFVKVSDPRLILLNQSVHRKCGYRWRVAEQFLPEYLIVIDDDVLLFPWQLKKLFERLIAEPDRPHGFAGMAQQSNGSLEYHQKVDLSVDYLCEIYAITGKMLTRYTYLRDHLQTNAIMTKIIETNGDFVVISQTGALKPKIHRLQHLLRCPTFNQAGVAAHKEEEFLDDVHTVAHALAGIKPYS